MEENNNNVNEDIFSKVLRAGRRTYFFDVRSTKAGDYYLTITESKKFTNEDGTFYYKKHKIYLYKEDFAEFNSSLNIGPGLNSNSKPRPSKTNNISLKSIATSKSNSSTGPHATSAASSAFLHNSSKVYLSFSC